MVTVSNSICNIFRQRLNVTISVAALSRYFSVQTKTPTCGLLIDIDGVLVQGNAVIPKVFETFQKLTSSSGKLILPTVFVTNSGNQLTKEKAEQLSKWLGIEVGEDNVVCSHDPFKCFTDFHEKNVLITGQGRVKEVARSVGFKKFVTLDDVLKVFPMLNAVDLTKRVYQTIPKDVEFSPVEAIVLLGEPVIWETSLQLIMDFLLTKGDPRRHHLEYTFPHLPVLACNMDLQWRSTPEIPRFGHGVFLLCLENVYKKISGRDLQYRVLVGKPSVVTYKYALRLIEQQAEELGVGGEIKNIYMIGDNINTDMLGGNLFNDYLKSIEDDDIDSSVRNCYSVLVKTGVSSEDVIDCQRNQVHRDFLDCNKTRWQPSYVAQDFSDAIDLIFRLEHLSWR